MDLARLAIKRPIFITCTVLLILVLGLASMLRLPLDHMPDVSFPIVLVTTVYPGAGPREVENLVSRPIEDGLSSLSGLKRMTSFSREGVSLVVAEFSMETDDKEAEQVTRDRVRALKYLLPTDAKDSTIQRFDMTDMPLMQLSLSGELPDGELFDVADRIVKPRLEQAALVGLVEIYGGRKREIRVELDRGRLLEAGLSAGQVAGALGGAGLDIPVGKVTDSSQVRLFRTTGAFQDVTAIGRSLVSYAGNEVPLRLTDLGSIVDGLEDEKSRTFINGKKGLTFMAYRRSGTNRLQAAENLKKEVERINRDLASDRGAPRVTVLWDSSKYVKLSVDDVKESILVGVALTVLVVLFFLGSIRSTVITSLALPNSLLGAFILMALAGFTINYMTLLALSLAVGLLVDDAIVVRENIWRRMEEGESPGLAAVNGTKEVRLAVVATSMVIMAVFGPVAFLEGMIGQFFKEFGLTVVFAMGISLYDSMTIAPMLSAYFAHGKGGGGGRLYKATLGPALAAFGRWQDRVDALYARVVRFCVAQPRRVLLGAGAFFLLSIGAVVLLPKGFMPPDDFGDFTVKLELPAGASLDAMQKAALEVDGIIRANPEVAVSTLVVGNRDGEANRAQVNVQMVPERDRRLNTQEMQEKVRGQLAHLKRYSPIVTLFDPMGGGDREFSLVLQGEELEELEAYGLKLYERLKAHPGLKDLDISFRPAKPELQIVPDEKAMARAGVSKTGLGMELRTQVEGVVAAKYREHGQEYDIRVRLKEEQRDLEKDFGRAWVPNMNYTLVPLKAVAKAVPAAGPTNIQRTNRARSVQIMGDLAGQQIGLQQVMDDARRLIDKELPAPKGVKYEFPGFGEMFEEMMVNMAIAAVLALIFIYFVLASLYEHFVTPFNIMLALPLALSGAWLALLVTGRQLDMFAMIGSIMLLGLAAKNSILLVDFANQKVDEGLTRDQAIIKAGEVRLRPILMTSAALIAGMLPVALGLNGAARQRAAMGVAVIGGLVSSTLLSLVVVPAAYATIDRFRARTSSWFRKPEDLKELKKEEA